jgi:hypothetical protein
MVFMWSHMEVSDEIHGRDRLLSLGFIEFLECICRISEVLYPLSLEEHTGTSQS